MLVKRSRGDSVERKLDELISTVQDLFILQALQAGMKVGDVRRSLKIDRRRVTNVSKHLRTNKPLGR